MLALPGVAIISYESIREFVVASRWDDHTYQVIAAIDTLAAELNHAVGASRGYVITGRAEYLGPWKGAIDQIGPSIELLQSLTIDNPAQQERIARLKPLMQQNVVFSEKLIEARREQGFAVAEERMATTSEQSLQDEIQGILHDTVGEENRLLGMRLRTAESNSRRSIAMVFGGSALSVGLISLAAWMVLRSNAARERIAKSLVARTAQLEAVDGELRETIERFKSLVESAKEYGIMMLDREGRIKTWNSGAQRLLGYTEAEAIGKHFSSFYAVEEREKGRPEDELRTAVERGQYEEDGWRLRKDGTKFWANVIVNPIFDRHGGHVGFLNITRDLTERIRLEEQAKNFFAVSPGLLCMVGKDGFFKRANSGWEKVLGYSETELNALQYLGLVHPEDRAAAPAADGMMAGGMPLGQFENRYRCKDGSYRWLMWKSAISADSQLIYAAATDITERKRTEEKIAGLNKTLQQQNVLLESTNKELEAFSYSVSHDLRTPLRSLDGFSQALLEDYSERLDDQGRNYLERVRAGSQRMGHLIDDLLNLSRVSRSDINREQVDLSKIAREVAEELKTAGGERGVEFAIEEGLVAETDSRLMRIALTNLLGNAWKFTSKRPNARIEFGSVKEKGGKVYFVRDNGAGFDPAHATKLFGAFQRLHSMNEFPGTGIGLATVQRIVQRQGGRVWAEGRVDAGATFYFSLEPFSANDNDGKQEHADVIGTTERN
jgi:PAS domain S-box-containing protein